MHNRNETLSSHSEDQCKAVQGAQCSPIRRVKDERPPTEIQALSSE